MKWIWILLCFVLSCGQAPQPLRTLRICYNVSPLTPDPRRSGDVVTSLFLCLLYEGLYRPGPSGELELGAADSVDLSSDGLTYRFHLRPATWSDGHPVTAYDFERSWKSHLQPDFPSLTCYLLYPIRNAEAARSGACSLSDVGIRALDAHTFEVTLERPYPLFPMLASFPSLLPVPQESEIGWTDPVTNGPFLLQTHILDARISLVRNPNYWDKAHVHLDTLEISILRDENTALQLFEQGRLDFLGSPLSPLPLDSLEKLAPYLTRSPMPATTFLTFQTQHPPFDNPHLRRALALALDRTLLTEQIAQGGELPATRCLPPPLNLTEGPSLYNPTLAREELLASHFDPAEPLRLTTSPTHLDRKLGEALQQQWKNTLGLTVQLETCEAKRFKTRLFERDYDLALSFWIAQIHDPLNILERFKEPHNPKNYTSWEDAPYRSSLESALIATTLPERNQHLIAAETRLLDQMPLTPLYHWAAYSLKGPRLRHLPTTNSGTPLFAFATLSDP